MKHNIIYFNFYYYIYILQPLSVQIMIHFVSDRTTHHSKEITQWKLNTHYLVNSQMLPLSHDGFYIVLYIVNNFRCHQKICQTMM